ncbi:hypothetical protein SLEP1_g40938 [Rubroshorea leprosula]|uniref:Uncharacterized protein n=1 Tax=Rubroshorea leprosula TaxID=152421 RepID=A0AAV5L694_9ROSI|nr:hypothetical protein SLEP1_g40938 [Rubroshorea leprosula]
MENGGTAAVAAESQSPIKKIITVAAIASGVEFGWALQLSLLTPYVQTLGVPYAWAFFIWLCGPFSGLVVQPIVGYYSDRCTSRFGRRRPFIIIGAVSFISAVFLIGFAIDIGHLAGDSLEKSLKPRAVAIFVVGFWVLDVANNMLQGPCRALLADLSANNHKMMRTANGWFSFFMAVGNVRGYLAGFYPKFYKIFPFTKTKACDINCANLKSCFLISIILMFIVTVTAVTTVKEKPLTKEAQDEDSEMASTSFVTYSIPFALASIYCSTTGGGQGLSLGVLNLSIVIPQMFVSVIGGPLDDAFGGSNLPAFVLGSIAAALSALMAIFLLPKPPNQASLAPGMGGGH